MVSANSRLVDGRLQKLRGGGTRFSEKVKSYLTAGFDVDTQTGRKPDLSEVATDKGTSSIILFQTVCNQQGKKGCVHVTPQNVMIAAKCNTNAKCNNIGAKCTKIFNAKCNNLSTQIVITFLTQNVIISE